MIFLDTSGPFCCLHRDEPQSRDAVAHFDASNSKIAHNYVLAELVALATARRLPRAATISFVADILDHPDIEIIWVTEFLHRVALQLLAAQLDKSYSLCDAVSFLVMRSRGIAKALTTDRHFEQAGFERLLDG